LQDEFAVVVARALGFPQFLRFSVGIFSKVNASVGVGACGMNGTDEVWVGGIEETAIAFGEFGHGGWIAFGSVLVSPRTEASVSLDNTPKLLGRLSLLK
jgi:hypothetical protein